MLCPFKATPGVFSTDLLRDLTDPSGAFADSIPGTFPSHRHFLTIAFSLSSVFMCRDYECHTVCGGQRTTFRDRLLPSTMWVPEIKLRLSALVTSQPFTHWASLGLLPSPYARLLLRIWEEPTATETSCPRISSSASWPGHFYKSPSF